MGVDPLTIAAVGFQAFSAFQGISAAKEQAKAIAQEGALNAENKKIETMRKAGAARASFLNSGFDIFGTPESSIAGIYDTGQSDIGRIISNANRKSKATVNNAVGEAFGKMANMASGANMGSFGVGGSSYYIPNVGIGTDIGDRMPWLT